MISFKPHAAHESPNLYNKVSSDLRVFFFFFLTVFRHSQAEVNLALEHGVPPDNIILSGVCKQLALVKAAAKHEVRHLVCENEAELAKIARLHPRAKSVVVAQDVQ